MCEKCTEIDEKIARYRRLVDAALDQLTQSRTNALIDDLIDEKARLHPQGEK